MAPSKADAPYADLSKDLCKNCKTQGRARIHLKMAAPPRCHSYPEAGVSFFISFATADAWARSIRISLTWAGDCGKVVILFKIQQRETILSGYLLTDIC